MYACMYGSLDITLSEVRKRLHANIWHNLMSYLKRDISVSKSIKGCLQSQGETQDPTYPACPSLSSLIMSSVRVDFTNTGSGIIQVSYSKSQTTNVSNFSVSSGQITSYNLDTNATYDFKFVLGRQEIHAVFIDECSLFVLLGFHTVSEPLSGMCLVRRHFLFVPY